MATKGRNQKPVDNKEPQPATDRRGGKKDAGNKQTQPSNDKRGGKTQADQPASDKRGNKKDAPQPAPDKRGRNKQAPEPEPEPTVPEPVPLHTRPFQLDFSDKPKWKVTDIPPGHLSLFDVWDDTVGKARPSYRPIIPKAAEKTIAADDKTREQQNQSTVPREERQTPVRRDNTAQEEEALKTCYKDLEQTREKLKIVNEKVEHYDSGWKAVPDRVGNAEAKMANKGYQMDDLEYRNKLHSAKIHELERELENVRVENTRIRGQIGPQDSPRGYGRDTYRENGYSDRQGYPDRQENGQYPYQTQNQGQGHGQGRMEALYDQGPRFRGEGRAVAENEQHRKAHGHVGPDGEEYWGFNKFYDPKYLTSYRREQLSYLSRQDEKQEQTQYADDYNYVQERQRRQEEEWRVRQRLQDEKWMKDKPRTYDYTAPYQADGPPRDINKYFHDSKFLREKPEPKPDDYYFNQEVPFRANPGTALTTYDRTYMGGRHEHDLTQQQPGGLYIVRFQDSGFDDVKVALSEQQTIVRTYHGHIIGVARRNHILSLEGDADWTFSRQQPATSRGGVPVRHVEDAIAVYWFTNYDKAYYFANNANKNRFRNQSFPTPQSWEGHFIPLLTPPLLKTLDTYMILEVLNVDRYRPENVQQFEAETRQGVLNYQPNCLPFVVSCVGGRYSPLKPGPHGNLFKHKSRIYVSRLSSLDHVLDLWKSGVIQGNLTKFGMTGPINVSAFALRDWTDH